MMWLIRAGQSSLYYNKFMEDSSIYIPWGGYKLDFSKINTRNELKYIVEREKGTDNSRSVSNWVGQVYSFTHEMNIDDWVIIPEQNSKTYCLAKIIGNYKYVPDERNKLYHSRKIRIYEQNIPRDIFSMHIVYSLGAFRTIFKIKYEKEVIKTIINWKTNNNGFKT